MFSRIAARCIHITMLILAAGTAGCIFAYNFISKKHKRDAGEDASYEWFDYYKLVVAGLAAFESFLWIVQSRVYENGRPSLQEIVLSLVFSAAYLFMAAWQVYHAYKDSSGSGFLCSTDGHDQLVDCRLWQAGLVGAVTCGFAFLFIALLWTCLFRQRHTISEDLPGELTPEITSDYLKDGNPTRDDAAAIAAEAERRQMLHRQKQQEDHRQMTLPNLGRTPAQPMQAHPNRRSMQFAPTQHPQQHHRLSHDAQELYYNPNYYTTTQAPYAEPMNSYQQPQQHQYTSTGYPNAHFQGSYAAYNGNTTPMTQEYGRNGSPIGEQPYTEEPTSYFDPNGQYYATPEGSHPYSPKAATAMSPNFAAATTASTTTAAASGSAVDIDAQVKAHREYANQLKLQQSYHENMAEALDRHAQSRRDGLNSGSTAPLYPAPPHSRNSIGAMSISGAGVVSAHSGDFNYSGRQGTLPSSSSNEGHSAKGAAIGAGRTYGDRTPSTPASTRHVGSPQQFYSEDQMASDQAGIGYADESKYRDELLDEVRRRRLDEFEGQQRQGSGSGSGTRGPEPGTSPHDYKVPIA